MKKALFLVFAALMIPGVAFASSTKAPPQATYELKGLLSNYTAYNAGTHTNGSITILVSDANAPAKALKGMSLTFAVDAKTKIVLEHHLTTITNGDDGTVKVVAAKDIAPAALATTLQASAAKEIQDRGVKKVPQATYEMKGALSNYTPYNAGTSTNGSITIWVVQANHRAKGLKGMTLTFPVDAKTKITLKDGLTTINNLDEGTIQVRAAKNILPAALAATLQLSAAKSIHDHGPKMANFDLRGTLSNYTAYNPVGPVNGSITILVSDTNKPAATLKGMTLTFIVGATTKITLEDGVTAILNGHKGKVQIRANKYTAPADLAAVLQATVAKHVVDKG